MWLKICYVLKNNKDKLLGYIHVPTKQQNLKEEIRWVPARNDANDDDARLRCVTTPELESVMFLNDENKSPFEKGKVLSYHEIDDIVCESDANKDVVDSKPTFEFTAKHNTVTEKLNDVRGDDDDDFNMKTLSLSDDTSSAEQYTTSENDVLHEPITEKREPKELTVEIRYKAKVGRNRATMGEKREVLSALTSEQNNVRREGEEKDNDDVDVVDDDDDEYEDACEEIVEDMEHEESRYIFLLYAYTSCLMFIGTSNFRISMLVFNPFSKIEPQVVISRLVALGALIKLPKICCLVSDKYFL